jgi:hypothetical protein
VAWNVSAVIGPTPGTVIRRRQISSLRASARTCFVNRAREGLEGREHGKFDHRRAKDGTGGADRERDGAAVGQIASWREQQEHGRDEHDR